MLATDINVGDHLQKTIGGLTFNLDTIWATVVAAVIVIGLGLALRRKATSGVPGKLQLVWEVIVGAVQQQVEGSDSPGGSPIVPFAVTLFLFILIANWFSFLGLGSDIEWLGPPTGDINLTLGLALVVIIPVHIASIRGPRWPQLPEALHTALQDPHPDQPHRGDRQTHYPGASVVRQPAVGRADAGSYRGARHRGRRTRADR